jgi:hypothetical protein
MRFSLLLPLVLFLLIIILSLNDGDTLSWLYLHAAQAFAIDPAWVLKHHVQITNLGHLLVPGRHAASD